MLVLRLIETFVIAFIGGYIFYLLDFPLPWVLGALTLVMLWQGFMKRNLLVPNAVRDAGFIILGIYFGLYFTKDTFQTVIPYFLPYVLLTIVLIVVCVVLGSIVSKWIKVDQTTSVFACIPGGLSEMAIASEALKGNSSLVVIFQTVRLIAVLFMIPPVMTLIFRDGGSSGTNVVVGEIFNGSLWNYGWFILPVIAAVFIRDKIPAGIIIGALGITAVMNVSPIELASVPSIVMNGAQIAVGASLGKKMIFEDLKVGGKYIFLYFGLAITIIAVSFGLGVALANFTTLNYPTAILSIAPGGFFEMVLTAYNVGGDAAVVSALQLVRVLLIVLCVPPALKWWFERNRKRTNLGDHHYHRSSTNFGE
ncbi:AbrB family transcriptional regulator [Ornithinibacillus sp. L9]|uniref:AbrB family transcriptional regulator n=1 Tax=Ornithinibacillus caprae TaxID=2678566 RepID=A0A6N8FDS9_9BACI|nr:AbrB family transcriptional regulator [Ornithinibacillus caprae]MUK87680.1 AbrB family transcriptional regulator [Ornithinibacillus caprae]